MPSSRIRLALLTLALPLVLMAWLASSAGAEVTGSQVTSPTDPTFMPLFVEPLGSASTQTASITGTTLTNDGNASDSVELGCFSTSQSGVQQENVIQSLEGKPVKLTVHPDGSFTTADLSGNGAVALMSFWSSQPCTLRAVPPSTAATANVEAFKGPRLGDAGMRSSGESASELYNDYLATATLQGYWGWESAGNCGPFGYVFAASTFQRTQSYVSDCEANLYEKNESGTAASIVINGHNGYDVTAASNINEGAPGEPYLELGAPSFDPASGNLSQTDTETIVRCESESGAPVDELSPSSSSCKKFAPTGVKLVRTVSTGQSGLQATVNDRFVSTDGASHPISVSYGEEQGQSGEPSYRFPGESSFTTRTAGSSAPAGSAPETIYFQANAKSVEPENAHENPRGAITLSAVPDAAKFAGDKNLELIYANRTVPASGTLTFIHVLSQALTQSQVEALAAGAQEQLAGPTLNISSPANGTIVATPTVQVSGSATANLGIASVTVNGTETTVAGSGSWSASTPLSVGANKITVVATDKAGKTATKTVTVTYTPAKSPPPPPKPHASQIGSVSGANGKVTFSLACVGPAGTKCIVKVSLTTIEKLKRGRIRGVVAKLRSRRVTVGSVTLSIPAGTQVKVSLKLNALGRKLLARFGKLPVHLSAVLAPTAGSPAKTVIAQNLTVRPVKRHKKHHR